MRKLINFLKRNDKHAGDDSALSFFIRTKWTLVLLISSLLLFFASKSSFWVDDNYPILAAILRIFAVTLLNISIINYLSKWTSYSLLKLRLTQRQAEVRLRSWFVRINLKAESLFSRIYSIYVVLIFQRILFITLISTFIWLFFKLSEYMLLDSINSLAFSAGRLASFTVYLTGLLLIVLAVFLLKNIFAILFYAVYQSIFNGLRRYTGNILSINRVNSLTELNRITPLDLGKVISWYLLVFLLLGFWSYFTQLGFVLTLVLASFVSFAVMTVLYLSRLTVSFGWALIRYSLRNWLPVSYLDIQSEGVEPKKLNYLKLQEEPAVHAGVLSKQALYYDLWDRFKDLYTNIKLFVFPNAKETSVTVYGNTFKQLVQEQDLIVDKILSNYLVIVKDKANNAYRFIYDFTNATWHKSRVYVDIYSFSALFDEVVVDSSDKYLGIAVGKDGDYTRYSWDKELNQWLRYLWHNELSSWVLDLRYVDLPLMYYIPELAYIIQELHADGGVLLGFDGYHLVFADSTGEEKLYRLQGKPGLIVDFKNTWKLVSS